MAFADSFANRRVPSRLLVGAALAAFIACGCSGRSGTRSDAHAGTAAVATIAGAPTSAAVASSAAGRPTSSTLVSSSRGGMLGQLAPARPAERPASIPDPWTNPAGFVVASMGEPYGIELGAGELACLGKVTVRVDPQGAWLDDPTSPVHAAVARCVAGSELEALAVWVDSTADLQDAPAAEFDCVETSLRQAAVVDRTTYRDVRTGCAAASAGHSG